MIRLSDPAPLAESFLFIAFDFRNEPLLTILLWTRCESSFFLIFFAGTALSRIGETPIQFVDRYGAPKDTAADKSPTKFSALVEGAIHRDG